MTDCCMCAVVVDIVDVDVDVDDDKVEVLQFLQSVYTEVEVDKRAMDKMGRLTQDILFLSPSDSYFTTNEVRDDPSYVQS